MPSLFLLFSHYLTDEQIKEANDVLNCNRITYLPEDLQSKWSHIDPVGSLDKKMISTFEQYLTDSTSIGDYVLIQGDFGMCYAMVSWCLNHERIPIYATTKRVHKEISNDQGEVKSIAVFKHINFRGYPK